MGGFHWWRQRDLLSSYTERFFEVIPGVFERSQNEFASAYFGSLFPTAVEASVLERSQQLLATLDDSQPMLQRQLRETNDDLERALMCRAFAASGDA